MGRDRRGLTLLELLLVIGLLLALGALVLPAVASRLDRRAFESGVETLRNQLLVARAHARLERRPVEVRYRPDPPLVSARFYEPGAEPEADAAAFGDAAPRGEPGTLIGEGWAHRPLPDGVRIAVESAYSFDEEELDPVATFGDPAALAGGEEPGHAPLRLAIFLPDGAALPGDPVWIVHDNGRKAHLSVDGWTGLAAIALTAPPEEGDDAQEDAEEPEDEIDEEDPFVGTRETLDEDGGDDLDVEEDGEEAPEP